MLALLGVTPAFPIIAYDNSGVATYDAVSHDFDINATPLTFRASAPTPSRAITNPRDVELHIQVDNSGNLIGGTAGDDLRIEGNVDLDGNPLTLADNLSGVLLTGEVLQFGFNDTGPSSTTDQFDFRFRPTGGALASFWAGKDIVITCSSEHSSFNDFNADFTGGAKGNIGAANQVAGKIVVDKITNPAGDTTSFDFNATGTGYNGFSLADTDAPNQQTVQPGTYSLSELLPAGWDLTDLTIDDPTADSSSVDGTATIQVGSTETVHVTYTNTKRGRIIVDKITNPAGDTTSFAFDTTGAGYGGFSLADADAPNDQELVPGSYSVSELVPAGWDLSDLTIVDPTGDSTSADNAATLSLAAGETITVTFTDTKRGRIIVDKITNPAGDTTNFTFNATGAGYTGFNLADADAPNDQELVPGSYSVSELVPAGWDLTDLTIVDPTGDSTSADNAATLNLAAGETITVTFTDTKRGRIIVDKITNPSGDTTSFAFDTTGAGFGTFSLADADAPNDQELVPGSYSVSELVPAGWDLTDLTVVDPTGDSTSADNAATLNLAAGETITVTFTDTKRGRIIVDKITNPSGDTTSFTFDATGAGYGGFNLTDAAAPNDQELVPGSYSVSEMVPAGWTLHNLSIVDPSGDSSTSGSTANLSLAPGETITVTYTDNKVSGSISGTKYLDETGNGLSPDDTGMGSVTIYIDSNNSGTFNAGEPSTLTAPDGTYSFTGINAGTYYVREIVPTDYVRTAPTLSDKYTVILPSGGASTGNNFANAEKCDKSILSEIVYIINGITAVSDLRGNTNEGDTVQVSFTVAAGHEPHVFTLVSYTAPGATFVASQASLQQIYDIDSQSFGPGTHTLTVTIPHSFYQVDFVCGEAIDRFGPEGSNIFYSAQTRLFSADNDGTHAVLAGGGSLSGFAYADMNNNGSVDMTDRVISGVIVKLTGTTYAGQSISQSSMTDTDGRYTFDNLPEGTYSIRETQFVSYTDGIDSMGSLGGSKQNDKFTSIVLPAGGAGVNYNFGEKQTVTGAYAGNQTANVAFWSSSNGQNLIKSLNGGSTSKNLANWLATNFNNMYGANAANNNLTNKTNSQVASFYRSLFSSSSKRLEAQTLALALNVYVTNSNLAGTAAASYGFAVSSTGLGAATASVQDNGAAFGVENGTLLTIMELLQRANVRARDGVLWDSNDNGLSSAETILRIQALELFSAVNNT